MFGGKCLLLHIFYIPSVCIRFVSFTVILLFGVGHECKQAVYLLIFSYFEALLALREYGTPIAHYSVRSLLS